MDTTAESRRDELLPLDDRARLEAIEEYRFEVRKRLEERGSKERNDPPWWKEKVLAPAAIVIITVALSGYVVPKVLEQSQKAQRERDVTNQLLDEIALNTGEMKVAIEAYARAQDTYWTDAARVNAIYREFLIRRNVGVITSEALEKEDALIENDRKRILDRVDLAGVEYQNQLRRFQTWAIRTRVRIRTLYPDNFDSIQAQALLGRIGKSVTRANEAVDKKQELYDDALNADIAAFKKLNAQLKARELTNEVYQQRATTIVDQLRRFGRIDGPARDLDDAAIDQVMAILRRITPVS